MIDKKCPFGHACTDEDVDLSEWSLGHDQAITTALSIVEEEAGL